MNKTDDPCKNNSLVNLESSFFSRKNNLDDQRKQHTANSYERDILTRETQVVAMVRQEKSVPAKRGKNVKPLNPVQKMAVR